MTRPRWEVRVHILLTEPVGPRTERVISVVTYRWRWLAEWRCTSWNTMQTVGDVMVWATLHRKPALPVIKVVDLYTPAIKKLSASLDEFAERERKRLAEPEHARADHQGAARDSRTET